MTALFSRAARTGILLALAGLLFPAFGFAQTQATPVDAAGKPTPPGLLFHASFDGQERLADVAVGDRLPTIGRYSDENYTAGGGVYGPGRFGQALTGLRGRTGSFSALGNINPARGTVCFYLRIKDLPYGHEVFVLNTVDYYYWTRYMRLEVTRLGTLRLTIPNEVYRPLLTPGLPGVESKLTPEKWHHVAAVWDQALGARLYLDGEEVAGSWDGSMSWLSPGVDPNGLWLRANANVAYDEVYIFDRPLSKEQIQQLASDNTPPTLAGEDGSHWTAQHRNNRLAELSWQDINPTGPVADTARTGLGANALKQVAPAQARAVMNECNMVFDGKLGTGWPGPYNPNFNNGNGLHVQVPEPFDLMAVEGYLQADIFQGYTLVQPTDRQRDGVLNGGQFLAYWRPQRPVAVEAGTKPNADRAGNEGHWLSIFKNWESQGQAQDRESITTNRVCELSFYRTGVSTLSGRPEASWQLGPATDDGLGDKVLGTQFSGRYWPGDRGVFSLQAQATSATQDVADLRYHHILLPASEAESVLSGLRLALRVSGDLADNAVRVQVMDPVLPARRLMLASFAVRHGGDGADEARKKQGPVPHDAPVWIDLTLDLADRVVPAGRPVWVVVVFRKPVRLHFGAPGQGSHIDRHAGPRDEAVRQHVAADIPLVLTRFAELSSPRPWGDLIDPEKVLVPHYRLAAEMFLPMVQIREIDPGNRINNALWMWTHKQTQDVSPVEATPVEGNPDAPRWALLQRELYRSCRDVFYWWIKHRQMPNGEFGDDLNDDTDFVQEFPKYTLNSDPGARIARSARAVVDATYRYGRVKDGVNVNTTDTLHAYEEGTNALCMLGMVDFGDPKTYERLMDCARTIEELFTRIDAHGRRRFRSGYLGLNEVRDAGNFGVDTYHNGLLVHPALTLAYYSRLPRATTFAVDYLNGWLAYFEDAARAGETRLPANTLLDGTVTRWDHRVRGFGFSGLFVAVASLTGEQRHRDALNYWTPVDKGSAAFRSSDAISILELADRQKHGKLMLTWSDTADLTRPFVDRFGHIARQVYLRYELTGDEAPAISALEASLRNIRTLYDAYTMGEPQNDRIYPPDQVATMMALGEIPYERNQTWPRHYVSYEGLDDFAAWVRTKSDTGLEVWIYNFQNTPAKGKLRVWRTPLGMYTVAVTPVDSQGRPTAQGRSASMELSRASAIPLTLPANAMVSVRITLEERSKEDFWARPDIAIGPKSISRTADGGLSVTVHNLGAGAAEKIIVQALDEQGNAVGETVVDRLAAPVDLVPQKAAVTLDGPDIAKARWVVIRLSAPGKDLYDVNNRAPIGAD